MLVRLDAASTPLFVFPMPACKTRRGRNPPARRSKPAWASPTFACSHLFLCGLRQGYPVGLQTGLFPQEGHPAPRIDPWRHLRKAEAPVPPLVAIRCIELGEGGRFALVQRHDVKAALGLVGCNGRRTSLEIKRRCEMRLRQVERRDLGFDDRGSSRARTAPGSSGFA